jgi:ABC-type bacteriocin/lantibiotic exporter with double-glycine peptidase domain
MTLKQWRDYLNQIGYMKAGKILPLLALNLLVTVSELLSIVLIFPIIQAFLNYDEFVQSKIAQVLLMNSFFQDGRSAAIFLVVLLAFTIIFRASISYWANKWIFRKIQDSESMFSSQQYARLLARDYLFFQGIPSSQIIRDIAISIPIGFSTVLQSLLIIFSEVIVFMGIAAYLVYLNPQFFIGTLTILGLCGFAYSFFIGPALVALGKERHELSHKTIGVISESIEGIGQIKNWQAEPLFLRLYQEKRFRMGQIAARHMAMQNMPRMYFESITMIIICGALFFFLKEGKDVSEFLPLLGFYVVAAFRILPSIVRLSAQYNNLASCEAAISTLLSFSSEEIHPKKSSVPIKIMKQLRVQDMSFSYQEAQVLDNLSVCIPAGSAIGIVGRSGEGKSTLINIVSGLIDAKDGDVIFDNSPASAEERLLSIGYISQNTFIVNGSIKDNVAFGVPEDDIDGDKVINALKAAQLQEFVSELGEGVNYQVGERGGRLSGGQRQRIGIARAFYFDRNILILDEATASLDAQTEKDFVEVLKCLKGYKTLIIVSHKPLPLSVCDVVYDMTAGHLISRDKAA